MTPKKLAAIFVAIASVATLAAVTVQGSTAGAATETAGKACSDTSKTVMKYHGEGEISETWTYYNNGVAWNDPTTLVLSKTHNVGTATITIDGCKSPTTGRWSVLDAYYLQTYNDLTVTTNGSHAKLSVHSSLWTAIGTKTTKITSTQVEGVGIACSNTAHSVGWFGGLALALTIPIDGTPYAVVVGQVIAATTLAGLDSGSTSSQCAEMQLPFSLPWSFSSSGVATLTVPSNTYAFNRASFSEPMNCNYQSCMMNLEDEVTLVKG